MDTLLGADWVILLVTASCIALGAGMIKGVVGFAMPTVLISALSSFMAPEIALAALIFPTLATNAWQALRHGLRAALLSLAKYRVFLLSGLAVLMLSAQLVSYFSQAALLLTIGIPVVLYAGAGLVGKMLTLPPKPGRRIEVGIGAIAGFFGGISGVWGPPTVALLNALDTPKAEHTRVQGVIYGFGTFALVGAHLTSGVLNPQTIPLSAALVPPAIIGLGIGFLIQDRIDQTLFRKLTLIVLVLAGLNLVRRGIILL